VSRVLALGRACRACRLGVLALLACQRAPPSAIEAASEPAPTSPSAAEKRGADLPPPVPPVVAPSASPSPPPLVRDASSRTQPACRATSLTGAIEREGTPLLVSALLAGAAPLELAPTATLHLTHSASARQWTLTGPARVIACDGGAEEIVLAHGRLRAEPGSGTRPGAEVWVATPYGSLRYADASAEITVNERELRVRVSTGQVWFSALTGAAAERALSNTTATFSAKTHRLSGEGATARCARDAERAELLAKALLGASSEPLGARAAEHVRARQRAHASCASARATTLAGGTGAGRDAETAALARYDQLWRAVPTLATPEAQRAR
jgi:hypothetical protein